MLHDGPLRDAYGLALHVAVMTMASSTSFFVVVVRLRIHHQRVLKTSIPLNQEHSFEHLAEEPLTLFRDVMRSISATRAACPWAKAQRRSVRGRWRGWDTVRALLKPTTVLNFPTTLVHSSCELGFSTASHHKNYSPPPAPQEEEKWYPVSDMVLASTTYAEAWVLERFVLSLEILRVELLLLLMPKLLSCNRAIFVCLPRLLAGAARMRGLRWSGWELKSITGGIRRLSQVIMAFGVISARLR